MSSDDDTENNMSRCNYSVLLCDILRVFKTNKKKLDYSFATQYLLRIVKNQYKNTDMHATKLH